MKNNKKAKKRCPIIKFFKYVPMIIMLMALTLLAILFGKDELQKPPSNY